MSELKILQPDSIKLPERETRSFTNFLQGMANRRFVGFLRYGSINTKQRYMSRMEKELQTYKRTGNLEHLYNIANYAFLESYSPEHTNQHHDATVESATRKRFGGAKD